MKKRMLLVANWKMNVVSEPDAINLFNSIKNVIGRVSTIEMVVCPPHIYLNQLVAEITSEHYSVGAQDAFPDESGNRTGETSIAMVKNAGAKYVILGNSERSHLEDRTDVARKVTSVLENELMPIVCIGEKDRDKN